MKVLLKIAWRNVWRNKTRSAVVIISVMLGIWALVFIMSFMRGMIDGYIRNAIQFQTSHIQVHDPAFREEPEIQYVIPDGDEVIREIRQRPDVEHMSGRLLINAMISSAKTVRGAQIRGVRPEDELDLTHFDQKLVEGDFLAADVRNPIVVSKTTLDDLQIKMRSKVVITFQGIDGNLVSGAFRVVGVFDTGNRRVDELLAFARYQDLHDLAGFMDGAYHEIAMNIHALDSVDSYAASLASAHPNLKVETYKEISPDLELFNSQIRINLIVMTTIVMLALIFGIINTMLMAVLERIRELGMLMAIGMNKARVFGMIMLETILLAIIGAPLGMLVGYFSTKSLEDTGIDLSIWSQGLKEFGLETVIYPRVDPTVYVILAIGISVTAVVAAIYPSFKAIRLRPVDALRKI